MTIRLLQNVCSVALAATVFLCGNPFAMAQETIDFSSQVRPILSDRCFHCHGPDADNQESDFRADSQEGLLEAVEPGDLDSSELHARIHSDDPGSLMPPPDSNRSLSDEEKRILDLWIEQGAPYEGHWAFEVPQKPELPTIDADDVKDLGWDEQRVSQWSKNPIDRFVAARLIKEGLSPSPPADHATLVRRAAMTLTGLLPDRDLQSKKYSDAVEALLDSDAYAERQALRWLDAARYADTDGYQNDNHRENWPWRDWVIKAFRDNMPFDQFTIEQIAGDMLPEATVSQRLASAFNRNHRQNGEGGALAEEFRVENVIDRVETTSTVFLGLTFGCARCHDHKYDPLSQREFFQMYAYFNNIGEKGIGRGLNANPTMKAISPLLEIDPKFVQAVEKAESELAKAKPEFEKRLKAWTQQTTELISRIDAASSKVIDSDEVSDSDELEDSDREAFESLDKKLVELLRNKKRNNGQNQQVRYHFTKIDPQQNGLQTALNVAKKELKDRGGVRATVMVMRERSGDPQPAYLLNRGQYNEPVKSDPLPRTVPEVLLAEEAEPPGDRLEFAKWLVSKSNPLTARVIVNRIWQDHFGIGLVKTSADFGVQGEAPSHPELLDCLAVEFIDSGWDVKAMHRLIVTSETYRQDSKQTPQLKSKDPQNRLLARGPRYRADGFAIRDVALQAAGLLSDQVGGPAVKPYQPSGLWEVVAANKGTRYVADKGENLYRRSMYSYWKRAVNPPRQTIFDAGGREICNVEVRRTNTPLQALVLMNDPTFVESARALAQQVIHSEQGDDKQKVAELYRRAIAKDASDSTIGVLTESVSYFREHYAAKPEEAKALLATGESKRDKQIDATEHAALAAVAHVILNLDEFLTIE
ncbi:PSD1 and planctomycete cytochrome C domain-containing protein [Mariniblastus fucicola]|uniref:Planctomycete cytochrome C n=1 Tax=Mariniblastus fucicola TaxID=980251 RepID=A0A5B9PDG2_9BACT|nr:PSD1 and planctomycete cytochrome C domain-containing protein [Mariniblastus fucicola]QEG24354.1 Planctomycete cytochrome C [Mariniblastus fucicola]